MASASGEGNLDDGPFELEIASFVRKHLRRQTEPVGRSWLEVDLDGLTSPIRGSRASPVCGPNWCAPGTRFAS
jgi:hypothetical protein